MNKIQVRNQAIQAILKAHSEGIFIKDKNSILLKYFHELLNHFFDSNSSENSKVKLDIHQALINLIYLIIVNDQKCEGASHYKQELIDQSKIYYFDLIFKYFNTFEEETKNWLIKIMFYKVIQSGKFKESSTKSILGPLTKDEFKSGMKHPASIDNNPML